MSDGEISFEIFVADKAAADRENAVFRLTVIIGPEAAAAWEKSLLSAIDELRSFPGPLANVIDDVATARFRRELRRLLFHGPKRRKSGAAYHILYTVFPPDENNVQVIRVLRILHASRGTAEESTEHGVAP